MHITSVKLECFKGMTTEHSIGRLTLLTGPNGSGKSAILEAVQYVLDGRTRAGATNEAAEGLFGPAGGMVGITLDDGTQIGRGLEIDHREHTTGGVVFIDGKVVPKKQADATIGERFGRDGAMFAPMFDLRKGFLDLSDDKRRDCVIDLCARASTGVAQANLRDLVELAYLAERLGEGTVALAAKDLAKLRAQLSEPEREALHTILTAVSFAMKSARDPAEQLNKGLESVKEHEKLSRRLRDEGHAAARSLAERAAGLLVVSESVEAMEARVATLNKDCQILGEQIARQEGFAASRKRATAALERARANLEALRAAPQPTAPDPSEIERLTAEIAELEREPEPSKELHERETVYHEASTTLNKARDAEDALYRARSNAQRDYEKAQAELQKLEEDDWAKVYAMLDEFHGALSPAVANWIYGIRQFVAAHRSTADRPTLEATIAETAKAAKELQEQYDAACTKHQEVKATCLAAREALTLARDKDQMAQHDARQRRARATELRNKIGALQLAASQSTMLADQAKADLQRAENAEIEAESELNRLDAEAGGFVPEADLRKQQAAISEQAVKLNAQIDGKKRFAVLSEELVQAKAAAEQQTLANEIARTLAESVRQVREDYMATLVMPLVREINDFLTAAGANWKAYCRLADENGKRIFDLGIERDNIRIKQPAMSGGEQVLFGAALAYALVQLANPKLKLLMLEAAECDAETLDRVLAACVALDHTLSNIIVATHLGIGTDWHGRGLWRVVDLAPAEAAA